MSRRAAAAAARATAELAAGLLLVTLVSYTAARLGLGNPFAGLGAGGYLGPEAEERLRSLYGLDESLLGGYAGFLRGLARGDTGPSLLLGGPAMAAALEALPRTLAVQVPAALASYLLALLLASAAPAAARRLRPLSFLPGYLYAVIAAAAGWLAGWPPPGETAGASKALAYAAVLVAAETPRLLHMLHGLLEASPWPGEHALALRAMGYPERRVRARLARTVLPAYTVYAAGLAAAATERSVLLEPLLGYTGLGYLLYRGASAGDPVLAATAFTLIGASGYAMLALGRLAARLMDPRRG